MTGANVSEKPMTRSMTIAIVGASPPNRYDPSVAALIAHPGHRFAKYTRMANTRPQCFQNRLKPVTAVSPVASVYRSTSMFRKNCVTHPTSAPQSRMSPTCDAMYGHSTNSPDDRPTPPATMPGPTSRQ